MGSHCTLCNAPNGGQINSMDHFPGGYYECQKLGQQLASHSIRSPWSSLHAHSARVQNIMAFRHHGGTIYRVGGSQMSKTGPTAGIPQHFTSKWATFTRIQSYPEVKKNVCMGERYIWRRGVPNGCEPAAVRSERSQLSPAGRAGVLHSAAPGHDLGLRHDRWPTHLQVCCSGNSGRRG